MDVRVVILSTVLDSDLPIQKLNSRRRCWGQWSMCWCRSSRRAVGWSTCSVPPESDCFCWRPAKQNGRAERSQCGPVGSAWMKWLFSPDGRVKANPSTLNEERKKKKGSNTNQWEVARWMQHTFHGARSKHLQNRLGRGKKMISHHKAEVFWCASVCPPLSSLIPSISTFYGPGIVGPLGQSHP